MKDPVIGIIGGKGQMGSLFASFFANNGIKVLISDKSTKLTNTELAKRSDIVIVSVPISVTEKVIQEITPHLQPESALMDLTSIKAKSIPLMLKAKCEVLGLHPMFGTTNRLKGQGIILCPTKKSGPYSKWIEEFFTTHGLKVSKLGPKEHDKVMSTVQRLIHFTSLVFGESLRLSGLSADEIFEFSSNSSRLRLMLMSRMLAQDENLYAEMQLSNPSSLKNLDNLTRASQKISKIIKKKDRAAFKKVFKENRDFFKKFNKKSLLQTTQILDSLVQHEAPEKEKIPQNALALLGPSLTYSDFAADKYLKESKQTLNKYFAQDLDQVFELVEKGKAAYGLLPFENKVHGSVRETIDGLFSHKVRIIREVEIPIHHCLGVLPSARKTDIKTISSHSQALAQCKKYLRGNFAKAEISASNSTSAAVQSLLFSWDKTLAVIAPEETLKKSELKILKKNIEDEKDNTTRFILIEKGEAKNLDGRKTSIAFYFAENSPGTLFSILKIFAEAKINLTRIESRPTRATFGEYIFHLDFENPKDPKLTSKIIKKVSSQVAKLKILGSY